MTGSANDYLGEFEHLVLLAVMQLAGEAHGAPVRRFIEERCDRNVSFGALYSTLRRLRAKGLVDATEAVGPSGRSRHVFSVTDRGIDAVEAAQQRLHRMSRGLSLRHS
jgi:DNA-binding PadR family transcriptional regulator